MVTPRTNPRGAETAPLPPREATHRTAGAASHHPIDAFNTCQHPRRSNRLARGTSRHITTRNSLDRAGWLLTSTREHPLAHAALAISTRRNLVLGPACTISTIASPVVRLGQTPQSSRNGARTPRKAVFTSRNGTFGTDHHKNTSAKPAHSPRYRNLKPAQWLAPPGGADFHSARRPLMRSGVQREASKCVARREERHFYASKCVTRPHACRGPPCPSHPPDCVPKAARCSPPSGRRAKLL